MDVGVLILPEHRWADAEAVWRRAEEIGFAHVWTYDHLAWRTLRDDPWHAAVPVLAAAAMVTSRIRLGTLVATPNFRHPVTFARELVTLDDLSDGRLTVGLGAGGPGWDASMLGQPTWSAGERAERFAEFVALLDRLLREPNTSYDGRYFRAVEARTAPGCVQRPRVPLAVAATGPRGMRVAATHGETWVTNGDRSYTGPPLAPKKGAAVFRRQAEMLDEVCRGLGRDPGTLRRLVLTGPRLDGGLASPDAFAEVVETYAAAGATDLVVHWPRPDEPYAGDPRVLDRVTL